VVEEHVTMVLALVLSKQRATVMTLASALARMVREEASDGKEIRVSRWRVAVVAVRIQQ
jgi:hypothetical protein